MCNNVYSVIYYLVIIDLFCMICIMEINNNNNKKQCQTKLQFEFVFNILMLIWSLLSSKQKNGVDARNLALNHAENLNQVKLWNIGQARKKKLTRFFFFLLINFHFNSIKCYISSFIFIVLRKEKNYFIFILFSFLFICICIAFKNETKSCALTLWQN